MPASPKLSQAQTQAAAPKRKRTAADLSKVESSNICKRIERAMRMVGVPTTEARTRYARLVGCVRAMRGSAPRWHAAWALYNIIKDWLHCPGDQPASENFQSTIELVEDELASLCHEN
jgi:hypothetical protein